MSWDDLAPFQGKKPQRVAVMFRVNPDSKRFTASCSIVIDLAEIPSPPAWLTHGGTVKVQIGSGDNAGELRLVPGKVFSIGKCAGHGSQIVVRIPMLNWVKTTKKASAPCEFDYSADWLSLTVPEVRDMEEVLQQASIKPVTKVPAPPKAPFASALSGVRHDVRRGT